MDATKKMISAEAIAMMKPTAVVLNFARDLLVDEEAMVKALAEGKIRKYVSDFPNPTTVGAPGCIVSPHLGASTEESEDNCAVIAVQEIRDYMENGNVKNSVNYPNCDMGICQTASRVAFLHKNEKGTIGSFTALLGDAGVNIQNMTNVARGNYAYSLIDIDGQVSDSMLERLSTIDEMYKVRIVK